MVSPICDVLCLTTFGEKAGFFPGVVYLLSTWYTRYEVGKRYAAFYLIGCVASAFGGILAFGLMQMEGVAGELMDIYHSKATFNTIPGYGGWRWIFIIEGLVSVPAPGTSRIERISFLSFSIISHTSLLA